MATHTYFNIYIFINIYKLRTLRRRCSTPGVGPEVEGLEALERWEKQSPPLHGQHEGKGSIGGHRILRFWVAREGKLQTPPVGRLSIGQHIEQFPGEGADAPFRMEKGRVSIWREEGENPLGKDLSLYLASCPLAWRRLPYRGGDSLQMHLVVIPGHNAGGVPCLEGSHRYLGDRGESLSWELPATHKKTLVGVIGTDRDGE